MANIPGTAASEQLNGTSASDTFIGSGGSDTISGGGGNDFVNYGGITGFPGIAGPITATFSGFALYAGQVTKTTGTDTLTGIRGVAGTTSGDTLIGTDQTDASAPFAVILRGGGGNDTIDGRNNTMNQASYVSATAAVVIDLGAGTAQDGQGGTDTLTNVIRVIGSNFNDSITGSARADRFDVSLGNDSYIGGGGSDTIDYAGFALTNYKVTATFGTVAAGLFGGASVIVQKISTTGGTNYTDTGNSINQIRATAFDDTLSGTTSTYSYYSANLRGNGGNDTIDGKGLATNRADYSSATAAAAVDLAAGTAQDGLGGSDTLINVVAVRGSGFNDTLMGAISNDVFGWSDAGAHTANGRGGVNTVYFSGTGAVTIDLGTSASVDFGGYQGSIVKGGGVTDTLSNFANAQGGYGNDTVSGTAADNQLSGGMGSNTIDGRGGYDYVNYRYFSGLDDPLHGATVNLGNGLTGTATNAWNGTDALFNIEGAIGTQLADDITGADLANGAVSYIRGEGGNDTLRAPTATAHVTVDYQDSLSGVTVNLATGQTTDDGWFGGQDTLINIHALRGSAFNDSITGSTGSDTLDGGGGSDVLIGGDGDDSIVYDAADSSVDGGLGTDTLLVYDQGAPTSFSLTGHALEAAVVTTHDLANNQSYSQYDEYFNASWARTAENIFFDNGQQDQAHFDVNNATSFSSYVDSFKLRRLTGE